jgi:hypothetical protein
MKFDAETFETVQRLVYPLVASLFDFDPAEYVGEKSKLFYEVSEAFDSLSVLFYVAAQSLEDGILSEDELNDIITKAVSVGVAIEDIVKFFNEADDEPAGGV